MLVVPPDAAYRAYFDLTTLTCLFCMLAVVSALRSIDFFTRLAYGVIERFSDLRAVVLLLVFITLIGSMFVTNDMALLMFLPLSYLVLSMTGKERYLMFCFIMQSIAANLGGMLTPFGNPQNLYIYSFYQVSVTDFITVMSGPFLVSAVLIAVCCLVFVKPEPIQLEKAHMRLPEGRLMAYGLLFCLALFVVFRLIPFWVGLVVITVVLLVLDRRALARVDYPLLLVFVCFFVFAGNVARMDVFQQFFSYWLNKDTLLLSALSCQLVSNVPAAVLLSQFTQDWPSLLLGVNIGGVGTPVASLASLIALREYQKQVAGGTKRYLALFLLLNFAFLILLILFVKVFLVR